jgi:hypothetical protein
VIVLVILVQVIVQVMCSLCREAGANVVQSMLCIGEGEGAEVYAEVVQRWRGAEVKRCTGAEEMQCADVVQMCRGADMEVVSWLLWCRACV